MILYVIYMQDKGVQIWMQIWIRIQITDTDTVYEYRCRLRIRIWIIWLWIRIRIVGMDADYGYRYGHEYDTLQRNRNRRLGDAYLTVFYFDIWKLNLIAWRARSNGSPGQKHIKQCISCQTYTKTQLRQQDGLRTP